MHIAPNILWPIPSISIGQLFGNYRQMNETSIIFPSLCQGEPFILQTMCILHALREHILAKWVIHRKAKMGYNKLDREIE